MATADIDEREAGDAPIATAETSCPHCHTRDDDVVLEGVEHEYPSTTTRRFPVVRCRRCGLVRLDPRPDVSELARIYPPEYYAYHLVSESSPPGRLSPGRAGEWIKRRMYQRQFEALVREHFATRDRVRVLDVGCADGRLLGWYRTAHLRQTIETFGIDISEEAVAVARSRGHEAVVGRFEVDEQLPAGTFDVVYASHVIEHVADPLAFARRASELLRPGGVFVFATPNVDSADVRRFGRFWGGWHFPRHWTLYDPTTAGDLATDAGLELVRVDYQVNPVFWNWTLHSWLTERLGRNVADKLFPPVAIFQPGLQSFVLLGIFTVIDRALRAATGASASMSLHARKI